MSVDMAKPLPEVQPWTQAFWEGTREGKLLIQVCRQCQVRIFAPRKRCPQCWSSDLGWIESAGKGTVYTFSTAYSGVEPRFTDELPYTIAYVDLAERIITVRCTKFFKTRLVPIGPKLADELAAHLERRGLLPMPLGKAAPLFASRGIRGWSYPRVIAMFQHVRRAAGINCPVGEPRPPRLYYMIFATPRPCTVSSHGIAPARTSSDCFRSSLPTLVTSISDRPSVTSE